MGAGINPRDFGSSISLYGAEGTTFGKSGLSCNSSKLSSSEKSTSSNRGGSFNPAACNFSVLLSNLLRLFCKYSGRVYSINWSSSDTSPHCFSLGPLPLASVVILACFLPRPLSFSTALALRVLAAAFFLLTDLRFMKFLYASSLSLSDQWTFSPLGRASCIVRLGDGSRSSAASDSLEDTFSWTTPE